MKHLLALTCTAVAFAASIACGGDGKLAAPATNATSAANAAAPTPAAPSGSPSAMPPPPTPSQASGQPLQDLFSARAVWPVRAEDATWKQVCGVSIVQVREG